MWIARPIYELLPYIYIALGSAMIAAAWFLKLEKLPSVLLGFGALSLMAGIVLWLRRRDYRTRQAEYSNQPLDD